MARHTGHSWPTEVVAQATKHGVERLILTHFNPLVSHTDPVDLRGVLQKRRLENTPEQAPRLIELARDNMAFDLI